MTRLLPIVLCLAVLGACGLPAADAAPGKTEPAPAAAKLLTAETRAWEAATPAFQKHCAKCHARGSKSATSKRLAHFDITSYPVGGHHADKIGVAVRKVLGLEGKKATMPMGKAGSVTGDDLAAIKAWTEAWDAADKAGAHAAAGVRHDH